MAEDTNFLRIYYDYVVIVMNNDCYVDIVNDKVPVAIAKLQKTLKCRLKFVKFYIEKLELAILYSNFGFLLINSDKTKFSLSFLTKALDMLERLSLDIEGRLKHKAFFVMKNMQIFMM